MIKFLKTKEEKIVHLKYEGEITDEDYKKVLIPQLEKKISKAAPLRVLADMRKVKGIGWKAMVDDYKFGMDHLKDFERMATVGDIWWLGPMMKVSNLFFKMDLKHFKSDQLEDAKKWIHTKH